MTTYSMEKADRPAKNIKVRVPAVCFIPLFHYQQVHHSPSLYSPISSQLCSVALRYVHVCCVCVCVTQGLLT